MKLFQTNISLNYLKKKDEKTIHKFIINYLNLLNNVENVTFNKELIPLIYTSVDFYTKDIENTLMSNVDNIINNDVIPSLISTLCDILVKYIIYL